MDLVNPPVNGFFADFQHNCYFVNLNLGASISFFIAHFGDVGR